MTHRLSVASGLFFASVFGMGACSDKSHSTPALDAGATDARGMDVGPFDTGLLIPDGGTSDAGYQDSGLGSDGGGADARVDWPEGCGGHEGPTPVAVHFERDGGVVDFCIDSTEVTVEQYARFYAAADPAVLVESEACSWKTDFNLGSEGAAQFPITNVDWCDAYAYCGWAGKHLCGNVAGGALVAATDPPLDGAFFATCTNNGVQAYPYGATYDASSCVTDRSRDEGVAPVASRLTCEGGVPGVYDLVGNVWEYIDSCQTESEKGPRETSCVFVGGPYGSTGPSYNCYSGTAWRREDRDVDVGFRCCSP